MNLRTKRYRILLAGLSFVFLALAGCSSWQPAQPVAVERTEWTASCANGSCLTSQHYDVKTTAKDEVLLAYLPPFMETTFDEYCRLMPAPVETEARMSIYLFDSRPEWETFTRVFAPEQAYTYMHIQSGGYTDHHRATAVVYDLGRDLTLALLAHEGMHQYLSRYFPEQVPAWLNEGLATQWESFDLHGDRPVYTPRKNFMRTNDLREALNLELISLPEMLNMNAGQAVRKTGRKVRTYYAQVWSMIIFLKEGKYSDKFKEMLSVAGTNRQKIVVQAYKATTPGADTLSDGEILFRQYITEDYDTFMKEYRHFAGLLVY